MDQDNRQLNSSDFSNDEIVILDHAGNYKVWQGGELNDFSPVPVVEPPKKEAKPEVTSAVLDTGMEGPFLAPLPPVARIEPLGKSKIKEEEIYNFYKVKPAEPITPVVKKYGINKIVDKINNTLVLNLDEGNKRRLKNILFSYSRHARGVVETLETIQRPMDSGGLSLKLIDAERLMAVVKSIVLKIENEGGQIIDEEKLKPIEIPKIPEPEPKAVKPIMEKPKSLEPKTVNFFEPKPPMATSQTKPVFIKPRLVKKQELPKVTRPEAVQGKQITEVKKKPLIFGPVEELTYFTLADWRRLSPDPSVRAKIILDKILLLGEESLTKKALGMKAWRQSEVHRLYLQLGGESIKRNLTVKQLIEDKLAKKLETLSEAEFEAVSDLSQKLRF